MLSISKTTWFYFAQSSSLIFSGVNASGPIQCMAKCLSPISLFSDISATTNKPASSHKVNPERSQKIIQFSELVIF